VPQSGSYLVKEIFGPTIQGEGFHSGRACVFLRFAVCNLACTWCDTDFRPQGAESLSAEAIAQRLVALDVAKSRLVVVTGGEPSLQWDAELAAAVAEAGFTAHMESNGTRRLHAPVDWLTVSPKPHFHPRSLELVATDPSEIKVVIDDVVSAETLDGYQQRYPQVRHWFAQPCMDDRHEHHLARTLELIGERPSWRLSVQLHKLVGVP